MRHGSSPSALAAGVDSDFLRPLSDQGRAEAKEAAQLLSQNGVSFDLILSSPLLRAAQTAEVLGELLHVPVASLPALDGSFGPSELWNVLLPSFSRYDCLIAVGHQPVMGFLAGALLRRAPVAFSPGNCMLLAFDGDVQGGGQLTEAKLELASN